MPEDVPRAFKSHASPGPHMDFDEKRKCEALTCPLCSLPFVSCSMPSSSCPLPQALSLACLIPLPIVADVVVFRNPEEALCSFYPFLNSHRCVPTCAFTCTPHAHTIRHRSCPEAHCSPYDQ